MMAASDSELVLGRREVLETDRQTGEERTGIDGRELCPSVVGNFVRQQQCSLVEDGRGILSPG